MKSLIEKWQAHPEEWRAAEREIITLLNAAKAETSTDAALWDAFGDVFYARVEPIFEDERRQASRLLLRQGRQSDVEIVPPIHVLPTLMREAIEGLHAITNVPPELTLLTTLAAASLAVSGKFNVDPVLWPAPKGIPISLYLLAIARSGHKKSTVFGNLLNGIQDHVDNQTVAFAKDVERFEIEDGSYKHMKNKAMKTEDERERQAVIATLKRPKPLRDINITTTSMTTNGINRLMERRPMLGIMTDEAGKILMGYSNKTASGAVEMLAALSSVWGGGPLENQTGVKGDVALDRRMTMLWMVQPTILARYFTNEENLGQGGLFRFLVAQVKKSYIEEVDETILDPAIVTAARTKLDAFNSHIKDLLDEPVRLKADPLDPFRLDVTIMGWQSDAIRHIKAWYNTNIVQVLRRTPSHHDESFLVRCSEHAIRLAAVIAAFECERHIHVRHIIAGTTLMEYFIQQRFTLDLSATPTGDMKIYTYALNLLHRLQRRHADQGEMAWSMREMTHHAVQGSFKALDAAIRIKILADMVERGWLIKSTITIAGKHVDKWKITPEGLAVAE